MPLSKRCSPASSSSRRTSSGKEGLPPPTRMGATNRWNSSTSPALIAWAASWGPPMLMSWSADPFICRMVSGLNSRSMRVRELETSPRVLE